MTITVTYPPAGYLGQGIYVFGSASTFTGGDFIQLNLSDFTLGIGACSARQEMASTSWFAQLGWNNIEQSFNVFANDGAAAGHAMSLQVSQWHSDYTLVESTTFDGYFHDPVTGLGGLIERLRSLGLGGLTSTQASQLEQAALGSQGGTFKFPLIGVLSPYLYIGNPVDGGLVRDMTPPAALAVYGMTWEVVSAPAYVGGQAGVITESNRRVVQFAVFHTLLGGVGFADQVYDSRAVTGAFFFDSPDPSNVAVYAYPGYIVNFSWLLVP